jgi:Sec-independent protein translocase protein TatA
MKMKIRIITFLLFLSTFSFAQYSNNERIIDSIIIEITKNYGEIYSDPVIQENSKKCYQEYKQSTLSFSSFYSNLLKKYNLEPLQNDFFDPILKLKEKDKSLSVQTFLSNLKIFSDSFNLNYPKDSIFKMSALENKFLVEKEENYTGTDNSNSENNIAYNYLSIENIIILILIILLFIFLVSHKKLKSKIKKLTRSIKNIEESKSSFNNNTYQEDRTQGYIRKIERLEIELEQCKKRLASESKSNIVLDTLSPVPSTENEDINLNIYNKSYYFRQPTNDGNFNNDLKIENFEPSISMFKLTLLSEHKAIFEYCGDKMMSKLISNNPNTHLGLVCDFMNTSDSFNSIIENHLQGEVELRNDIWFVTKKAKIKFS